MPPTEDMDVQVRHGLPAILTGVDHSSKSTIGNPLLLRNRTSETKQRAEQGIVLGYGEGVDVLPGNHEHVERRLWIDVTERDCIVRLGDECRPDITTRDSAEQTFIRHATVPQ